MTTLTSEQLDKISTRLDERNKKLREEIRQELLRADEERYIDLAGDVHDAGEESVADMLADLNIAMIDRQVNEIRQIEAAQVRIATGNYGICTDCEEEIDIARLLNTPYAERCVSCQSRYEKSPAYKNAARL